MLKKMGKYLVVGIVGIFVATTGVNALEVKDFNELNACLTSEDETTCTVTQDITFTSNIVVKGTKTLDLNGYTLTLGNNKVEIVGEDQNANLTVIDNGEKGTVIASNRAFEVTYGGTLNVTKATINASQGIGIWGYEDPTSVKTTVTVREDVTMNVINSEGNGAGIAVFYDEDKGSYGVVVDFYGTIHANENNGFTINGKVNKDGENVPVFNIYDSASIDAPTGVAIYGAGYAEWNIFGGSFSGPESLSIKAGIYNITGGEFHATGEFFDPALEYDNGSESTGAAISVTANDSYAMKVELNISNVIAKSDKGYALYEGISVNNEGEPVVDSSAIKSITIQSGTFTGAEGAIKISSKDEVSSFITGGTYNTSIDVDYVKDSYVVEQDGENYVVKPNLVIATDDENVTFESEEPLPNDYTLVVEEEKLENEEEVEASITEEITAILEKEEEKLLDSKLVATYDISVIDSNDQVVKLENGNYVISIKVTDEQVKGFTAFKLAYLDDAGKVAEILDATLKDGVVTFETSHLSTYAIIGYNAVTLSEEDNPTIGDSDDTTTPNTPSEETPEVPQTFDSLSIYVGVGLISIAAIVGAVFYIKRKQTN